MNLISILGNSVVLYIFLTKYESRSNYRLFVLSLAVLDIGTAIGHVLKEETRIKRVYYGGNNHLYAITNYIGYSIGFASLLAVLFITVERYKKICSPFGDQITLKQSKIMCVVVIVAGSILNFPICIFYGKRTIELDNNITATRCSVLSRFDSSFLPIAHFGFLTIQTFVPLDRYLHQEIQISMLYEYFPDVVTLNAVFNPFVYHFTDSKFKSEVKVMWRRWFIACSKLYTFVFTTLETGGRNIKHAKFFHK